MKKISIPSYVFMLSAVLWIIIGMVIAGSAGYFDDPTFYYWGGFGFVVIGFAIIILNSIFGGVKKNNATEEYNMLPPYYSVVFIVVTMILNIIFMAIGDGDKYALHIILNLIVIGAYSVVIFFVHKLGGDITKKVENVTAKQQPMVDAQRQLGACIAMAVDPNVKAKITALNTKLIHSNSLSQSFTENLDMTFAGQIAQIQNALIQGADPAGVIAMIDAAERTLDARNAMFV